MASIDELKSRIDCHDLAERLGMERPGGKGNYRSPHRKDNNPSVGISRDGKRWKDYATGEGGSCVDLVMYVENLAEVSDAVRRLHELYGIPFDRPERPAEPVQKSIAEYIADRCLANAQARADDLLEYLVGQRKIAEEAVRHAIQRGMLGWNDWTSDKVPPGEVGHGGPGAAFIVRTLNPGRVAAVDVRYQDPGLNGGVKTQTQGEKHGLIWTSDLKRLARAHTVYVVESAINVLSIDSCNQAGWAAVATRGVSNVELIDWRFLRGKKVVLAFDNDPADDGSRRPEMKGLCPGDLAAWKTHEILTGLDIACHLVDQGPWCDGSETGVRFNDVNDILQEYGPRELLGYLRTLQQWVIPGVRGDKESKKPGAKPRIFLPPYDWTQYWKFRAKEDFTTFVKMKKTEDGDEEETFQDLCGFRVAGLSRVRIQSATATMTGEQDAQPHTVFSVSVQTPRHGNQLLRKVFVDEKLHNLDQWGKFGPIFAKAQFSRMVSILERAAGIGARDAVNFVGLAWRDGRPAVNEGPDCYFTEPEKQCPYHNLLFPSGPQHDARTVIEAYQATFKKNAAMQVLTWILGGHLKAFLGFWPHMILQANKGAGKSTLVKRLERTTGMTMFSGQSLQTEFRMLTSISHTSHPVGWEEISARRQDVIDKAVSLLQECYQYTVTKRGPELTEYLLSAPVLLAGEDVPVRSLLGKVVRAELSGRKGEMLPENLPRFPVREWLQFLAGHSRSQINQLYERARKFCVQHSRASGTDDGALRMAGNYAAVATAWRLLAEFAGIHEATGDFLPDLYEEMNRHIGETSADREPWVWILECLFDEIAAGNFRHPYKFQMVEDEECLLVRSSYVMHHLKTTLALRDTWNALPVKSDRVFKKQLIEAGVVLKDRIDVTIGTRRECHLTALSLSALARYGLHPARPTDESREPTAWPE